MHGDTLCLRPVTLQYGVVRLMDFAILQSGLHLSDVLIALHRFPSIHAPVFLGWHLNRVGPLPPPATTTMTARRQGPPFDRRARGTSTATLDYVRKTLHRGALLLSDSGRPIRVHTRREVRLAGLALCPLRCNPAEERSEPQQPDLLAPR